jgi:magnesium transporter
MIYFYFKTAKQEVFSILKEPKHGCWIHVDEATLNDLHHICQLTGLELSDLQDSLDRYELPRIEKLGSSLLLHTRHPIEHEGHLHTMTLTIVLTPHYFITISPIHNHFIQAFVNKKSTFSSLQKFEMLSHLLLRFIQEFTAQIRKARHNVMTQEKEMSRVDSEDISALTKYEEILNQYYSALGSIRAVLESIVQGRFSHVFSTEQSELDDVLNTVKQAEDLCNIVIKNIRSLRDSYQIIFANNLTKTIKLLTALTIIFSVPTMIASIYGMNVDLPIAHEPHAFSILMLIIICCSALCGYLFHRKKWL